MAFRAAFRAFGRSYPVPPGRRFEVSTILIAGLASLLALSLVIWICHPVAQGHSYGTAPALYGLLLLVAVLHATWQRWGARTSVSVRLFGPLAVAALGLAVYCTRWLRELDGLFAISIAFLALTTTPEPQFVPAVLYIAAAARLTAVRSRAARPR